MQDLASTYLSLQAQSQREDDRDRELRLALLSRPDIDPAKVFPEIFGATNEDKLTGDDPYEIMSDESPPDDIFEIMRMIDSEEMALSASEMDAVDREEGVWIDPRLREEMME